MAPDAVDARYQYAASNLQVKEEAPIYTLRSMLGGDTYHLAKWPGFGEGHKVPSDTYLMTKVYCGCPSPRKPCKHIPIRDALLSYAHQQGLQLHQLAYQDGNVFQLWDMIPPNKEDG